MMATVTDDPTRKLVAAILLRAVRDALDCGDPDVAAPAQRWLASEGVVLAEALDIPPERVTKWLAGLPGLPYEQLPLFE